MPTVTYNGQSFAIDGRRIWVLGASIQYARTPVASWADRIAAARQAGFNTVVTSCPWLLHEPRRGRFQFQGDTDVRRFIQTCGEAGMRVILRAGPYIGDHFDGGGIPAWLAEMPGVMLREANEVFLEHVSRYFRRLLSEVADLQATQSGPILLVQSEHAWTCSNDDQAERYLHEITRFIRESGITVPLINANDLWQESPGTIDTWSGYDDLLIHLRQLRTLQSNAPRLVSAFDAAGFDTWGATAKTGRAKSSDNHTDAASKSPDAVLRRVAEILAAGAQPIVSPFHGGTNFGFLGGRLAGCPDGFMTTSAAKDAPLGEAGGRGPKYLALKRLMTFANHFSSLFAELEPDYHPIVLDPADAERAPAPSRSRRKAAAPVPGVTVVPLRGSQGRVAFVFANGSHASASLILNDGIRLPVNLGEQPVGWYVLDADLQGAGRLDFANLCPWAIVDREIIVFFGPPKSQVYLSVDGTPLEAVVPAEGGKPLVVDHKGLTVVICNQTQIDLTYHNGTAVYVGISGFDSHGAPLPAAGHPKAWVIRKDCRVESLTFDQESPPVQRRNGRRESNGVALHEWQAASAELYANGQSPRFASLDGPETLSACGASFGYGWYRVKISGSGKKLCHAPFAADRMHLFLDGQARGVIGVGPGAKAGPFDLKLGKGAQTLVALLDNLGRFSDGNDLAQAKGLYGHLYEVKAMRAAKPKIMTADPINPFTMRGFIAGRDASQLSDTTQVAWTITHAKKSPILVDVNGAAATGTFLLNDQPLAYYAGATGACFGRIMLDPKTTPAFKRGKNVLRFAPDLRQDDAANELAKCTTIYECVNALTEGASWAFAKWEPPLTTAFHTVNKTDARTLKGLPCWWRTTFTVEADSARIAMPLWLEVIGLSKGQAYINGHNLGRYFTATGEGKAVGPQTRLYVPDSWLKYGQPNELLIFDEHGYEPFRVKLTFSPDSDGA